MPMTPSSCWSGSRRRIVSSDSSWTRTGAFRASLVDEQKRNALRYYPIIIQDNTFNTNR